VKLKKYPINGLRKVADKSFSVELEITVW